MYKYEFVNAAGRFMLITLAKPITEKERVKYLDIMGDGAKWRPLIDIPKHYGIHDQLQATQKELAAEKRKVQKLAELIERMQEQGK